MRLPRLTDIQPNVIGMDQVTSPHRSILATGADAVLPVSKVHRPRRLRCAVLARRNPGRHLGTVRTSPRVAQALPK